MAFGISDPDNMWLAWDGISQAVLGYCGQEGAAGAEFETVVVCHTEPLAGSGLQRQDIVTDLFRIASGRSFYRPVSLPAGTVSVEVLLSHPSTDDNNPSAFPVKTFYLVRQAPQSEAKKRTGTIILSLESGGTAAIDCRFMWSEEPYVFKDPKHVGWAAQFDCWRMSQTAGKPLEAWVAPLTLAVPHSTSALKIAASVVVYSEPEADRQSTATGNSVRAVAGEGKRAHYVQIQLQGNQLARLNGIYIIHVNKQRQKARDWEKHVSLDAEVFDRLAMHLTDRYRLMNESGHFGHDAQALADSFHSSLTQDYTWHHLAETSSRFDVFVEAEKTKINFHYISLKDDLLFFDTKNRTVQIGSKKVPNGIAAFHVGFRRLEESNGVYSPAHPVIQEVMAERALHLLAPENSEDFAFKPGMRNWLAEAGAPLTPFGLTPLLALFAMNAGFKPDMLKQAWPLLSKDGAAWALAAEMDSTLFGSIPKASFSGAGVVNRALSALGRPLALERPESELDAFETPIALLRCAGSQELRLGMEFFDFIDLRSDDLSELAGHAAEIKELLGIEGFADWLKESNPVLAGVFLDRRLLARPIDKRIADAQLSKLRTAAKAFKPIKNMLDRLAKGTPEHEDISYMAPEPTETILVRVRNSGLEDPGLIDYVEKVTKKDNTNYVKDRVEKILVERNPSLKKQGNPEIAQMLNTIEHGLGGQIDGTVRKNAAESIRMLGLEPMPKVKEKTARQAKALRPDNDADRELIRLLPDIAAALALQKIRTAMDNLIDKYEVTGQQIPIELKRQLQVWPEDSARACSEFLEFELTNQDILGEDLRILVNAFDA